jgi:hypothetical protein
MAGKSTVILIVAVILSASIAASSAGYLGLKVGPTYQKNMQCCALPRLTNLFLSLKEFAGFLEFHSQIDQDRWIVHGVFPGVTNGYFVDVGSGDGGRDSNTKVLEDLGWTGVCVDPFPTNMNNRTCAMFKEVVDSAAGRKVRFRTAGFIGGIENYLGITKEWERVKQAEVVELTTTTLEDILARAKAPNFIHYISLDIEGGELEALRGFPFSKHKVGAFTIEHNFEEPKRSQIKALLESQGYRRVRSGEQDDYYMLDQK